MGLRQQNVPGREIWDLVPEAGLHRVPGVGDVVAVEDSEHALDGADEEGEEGEGEEREEKRGIRGIIVSKKRRKTSFRLWRRKSSCGLRGLNPGSRYPTTLRQI
jgi:hypothetical protein